MVENIIYSEKRLYWKEIGIVATLLFISLLFHGVNMFHYPYYENDEGTYMSQAWSLLTAGKLAPYTYWYDHAPAGWILIALWVKLTGGFFTFGPTVNSGRVLMLLLHMGTSFLLYYCAKKLSGLRYAGILAVIIFSITPLGIYFQRRVLLDNIMIFWVFASLTLLIKSGEKLSSLLWSAVFFGIAILTKENAVFFIPVFLYLIFKKVTKHQREFLLVKWLAVTSIVTSLYFLYALLKNEFFPVGFMGDTSERVSLITTLKNQFGRGVPLPFWHTESYFYTNFIGWIKKDPFIMGAGIMATAIGLLCSIWEKRFRIPIFLSILFWLFLLRGKLVIDFYITPLIPILALCIGVTTAVALEKISLGKKWVRNMIGLMILLFTIYFQNSFPPIHLYKNETGNQIKALNWIKENLPSDTSMVIDASIFVDLHAARFEGDPVFPNADWSWKVEQDPEIYKDKLQNDWAKITYVILSHEMLKQIYEGNFPLTRKALDNASLVKAWDEGSTSYIDIEKHISTNGDWMAVYKVEDKNKIVLDLAWEFYKGNFLKSYGQIVDPATNNTTSEGQSYALLRAVWQDDHETFDRVWQWTQDHLQFRGEDALFSWLWLNDNADGLLGDTEAASDADEDTALALIIAYTRWRDNTYLAAAREIVTDIWDREIVEIAGNYYIISGPSSEREEGYLVNPSYFAPASYRVFSYIDPIHPWNDVADSAYLLLNKLGKSSPTYLPPNWILIDKETGEIKSPGNYIQDISHNWYGFDAFRIMWRVILDKEWFDRKEAVDYLTKVQPFFEKQMEDKIYAIYSLDGSPRANYSSLSTTTGAVFALYGTNRAKADELYNKEIEGKFNMDEGYWGEKDNYYDQNWAWFAKALYSGYITNPWE